MTTITCTPTPRTNPDSGESMRGLFIVLASKSREWLTEPVSLREVALVPVPHAADEMWNTREVRLRVTMSGAYQLVFFIDADGQLHREGAYPHEGAWMGPGDSIILLRFHFRLRGFTL